MNGFLPKTFLALSLILGADCHSGGIAQVADAVANLPTPEADDDDPAEPKPPQSKTRQSGQKNEPLAKEKAHKKISVYELGEGPKSYMLFEPAGPKPKRAPVVVFLHGWFAVNPAIYGAWIEHLVGEGRIVIFPRYQNDVSTSPQEFLSNALEAIRDALGVLETGRGHVRPRLDQFALIGHSAGGNLSAYIAAVASDPQSGIPVPRAVVALMPGEVFPQTEPKLSNIPEKTLLAVIVGEEDLLVGDMRGREIFAGATAIPKSRKRFILFRSDRHGFPPLIAEHTAPTGASRRLDTGDGLLKSLQMTLGDVNAFDHAGFWRIADQTFEAAFADKPFKPLSQDPEQFRHLGYWSDGRRVTPPIVADNLNEVPRLILSNGVRIFPWRLPERLGAVEKKFGTKSR